MSEMPPRRSCFLVVFGGVFALIGAAVLVFGIYDYTQAIGTYRWRPVPAKVQSISVNYPNKAPSGSENSPFELAVDYEYDVDGKSYSNDQFRRKSVRDGSYQKLADVRWRLIKEEVSHAYVNPTDATEAILERESLGPGLIFILFPLPFVVIGLGLFAGGMGWFNSYKFKEEDLHSRHRKQLNESSFSRASLGNRANYASCFMKLFGAIFMTVALFVAYGLVYLPITKALDAKTWVETPCTVVWSRVEIHEGEDNDESYSADVFFEYEYDGETHRSNDYSFMNNTSSGSSRAAKAIVREFSAGKKATCFVDPNIPWHAVIVRDASQVGLWALLPAVFFVVGAGVFFASFKAKS